MQDLLFSLRTVFPLLVLMAAGFAARQLHWLSDSAARQMNNCVYRLFLPVLLCLSIMDTDAHAAVDGLTLLYAFVGTMVCFGAMFWIAPRVCKQRDACGVLIQGIARSNYAIFGIPLVMSMYPGADTSVAAMMVAVAVPVFNVMSTVALMVYGKENASARQIVRGILLNPLMLGTAAGLLLWRLNLPLPSLLMDSLRRLGSIATPLALFLLGASLDFQKARTNARLLFISVFGRLLAVPLVFLPIALGLGIRGVPLATLVAVFASPVAVSSYPMVQQMGGDDALAAGQVVFTTVLSILTVFLWVLTLKRFGYLG